MENLARNEMLITLGEEKILLRPTFENLSAMESKLGGIAWLAYKFGRGLDMDTMKIDPGVSARNMPTLGEAAQIIFFNQAEKKFTQEEIFDLCLDQGISVCAHVVLFLGRMSAGNKMQRGLSDRQKKSSSKKNQAAKD
jgi:hypothetical protein